MIFEDKIGIKLCITGCIGALALIVTGVISEKQALKSIDLKTIFLFGGTLSLASALSKSGAGEMIANKVIGLLGDNPSPYLLTFVVFIVLFGGHLTSGDLGQFVVQEVCGGGLILGAFFMATDYVTSPITPKGKIIYGIICGCLLGIFRMFGASAEGCSYSIIFANMLVPLIERFTIPKPFGKGGEK
mgnify:CR=1 FL=1